MVAEGRWETNVAPRAALNRTPAGEGRQQTSSVPSVRGDCLRDRGERTEAWMLVSGEDKQRGESSSGITQVYSVSSYLASSTLFPLLARP